MPNTTNFNFPTPADTDLVKDGALAIRNLGNSIDTAFVDLKGGTTGQVLSKNSNTDLDYAWVAQDDSNAIQNAIIDAKGDLIVGTAADTPARLAVGATNGHVLTVDSAEATGIKWAAVAGGAGNMAQIASGTLSGTSVSLTGLSTYTELLLQVNSINVSGSTNVKYTYGINNNTGSNYSQGGTAQIVGSTNTWYYDTMSSFFGTYQTMAFRSNSNNICFIKFTNCKNAGFTDIDMISHYNNSNPTPVYEFSKGVYTVAEAVSSIQIKNDSSATFSQGSYILWGA